MIKTKTRHKIKGYLEGFIQAIVADKTASGLNPKDLRPARDFDKKGKLKPFHESLLPDGLPEHHRV